MALQSFLVGEPPRGGKRVVVLSSRPDRVPSWQCHRVTLPWRCQGWSPQALSLGRGTSGVGAPECQIAIGARLGRILSDVGRRLVEVIYKDPIGGRFPSGYQFCEEVGIIVVLLRDMMEFDPSDLVLELAHLLAIHRHERALVGGLLDDLVGDQL